MKKVLRRTLRWLGTLCLAAVAVYEAYEHRGLLRESSGLRIDRTDNVVENIRSIGEFTSAYYYEEMVLHGSKENDFAKTRLGSFADEKLNIRLGDDIVIIASGKVRAGFDLSRIEAGDLRMEGDTLFLSLPPARILDVIINPSGYEVFAESGSWSHAAVVHLESRARETLRRNAEDYGLAEKAEQYGIERLQTFLKTFGFGEVCIRVREDSGAL